MRNTKPDHSQLTIDTRFDDIQIQLTDLVRRRVEGSGLSQEDAASRMQVELSNLARALNPRTALRLTVPQAIDLAFRAGLDQELQASVEMDGLTLFHGGALKRSAYEDGVRMMSALEAEAAEALKAHLALNDMTIEDYVQAIRDQRDETALDFAKATGAERMLALLDYRGCSVEIASRIYDAPEANLLANPDATARVPQKPEQDEDPEMAALRELVTKRFGSEAPALQEPKAAAAERPFPDLFRFGEAPEDRVAPRPKPVSAPIKQDESPKPEAGFQTSEQERKSAGDVARRALAAAQDQISQAFAKEVEKTGMSHAEVAETIDEQVTWVRQVCSDERKHVSLRKTLELCQKIGLDVELDVEVLVDGAKLPVSESPRLSQFSKSTNYLYAVTSSLTPAINWLRNDMKMSVQQMAQASGLAASSIQALAAPQPSAIPPHRALSLLAQLGCDLSITPKVHSAPVKAIKEAEAEQPAAQQALPETALAPNASVAEAFDTHQTRLIEGIKVQVAASELSASDVASRVGMLKYQVERALRDEVFTLPSVLQLASDVGIDTQAHLRVRYNGAVMGDTISLKVSDHQTAAEFLSHFSSGAREFLRAMINDDPRPQKDIARNLGISQSHLCNLSRPAAKVSPQSVLSFIEKMGGKIELGFRANYDAARNKLRENTPELEAAAPGMR